jgi:uncharacterized membrane-anchored protein YhcB (DUF1043 family)
MNTPIAVTIGMMIGFFLGFLTCCVLAGERKAELDNEIIDLRRKLDERV